MKIIKEIISNTLEALYQPFLFAFILSIFVMFFVMYLSKYNELPIKERIFLAIKDWKNRLCNSKGFRRKFYFVFCLVMVLFKTLMNRWIWVNPITNVMGIWGFHKKNGDFTTEIIENTVLFIPLIFFLFFFLETTAKKVTKFIPVKIGRAHV